MSQWSSYEESLAELKKVISRKKSALIRKYGKGVQKAWKK
jgi:hypothetical protein